MRVTVRDLQAFKARGERLPMVTAYDATTAALVEAAGIPIILVGDSLGQVMLGYDTTVPVTVDQMLHHVQAVVRGCRRPHIVADMPFMSYQAGPVDALHNAGRLLKEGGAQSVKLEGGRAVAGTVRRLVEAGIPVMGHIGLTPQAVHRLGGYRVQGRTAPEATRLLEDALTLEEAGAYAIVLELVPAPVAQTITSRLRIPTIGIGSGPHCDGQVLVLHDLLGLQPDFKPRHARRYAEVGQTIVHAVTRYADDVRKGAFPSEAESFSAPREVAEALMSEAGREGR